MKCNRWILVQRGWFPKVFPLFLFSPGCFLATHTWYVRQEFVVQQLLSKSVLLALERKYADTYFTIVSARLTAGTDTAFDTLSLSSAWHNGSKGPGGIFLKCGCRIYTLTCHGAGSVVTLVNTSWKVEIQCVTMFCQSLLRWVESRGHPLILHLIWCKNYQHRLFVALPYSRLIG